MSTRKLILIMVLLGILITAGMLFCIKAFYNDAPKKESTTAIDIIPG